MKIPQAVMEQHVAVLGKTRSGKSSVMRGLVEGLLECEQPVCIIDPKGDWWGIKLARDGKHAGYPVVIFGGEHADVPINERAGAYVAELYATGNRPCLIDLGGWMVGERTRFYIDFASTLFKLTKGMRWLVIDEIHNFAPKGKIMDPSANKALHWTNRLASEGLGKGLPMIFASQRPQKVHNDTLTSAETLIAMRVLHPSDRGAVSDWIKGCGDLALGERVLSSLAQMDRGEGWIWSPEIGLGPERVKFPMFKTYDSFRPQTAEEAAGLKGWASVDLEDVKAKLAIVVKEAEANDPKLLRAEIVKLKTDIAKFVGGHIVTPNDVRAQVEDIKASVDDAFQKGREEGWNAAKTQLYQALKTAVQRVVEPLALATASINTSIAACDLLDDSEPRTTIVNLTGNKFDAKQVREVIGQVGDLNDWRARNPKRPTRTPAPVNGNGKLAKVERTFLTVLAQQNRALTRNQVAIFARYSAKSRHVDNTLASLRAAGHIVGGRESIDITDNGMRALGAYDPLPTGAELLAHWMSSLDKAASAFLGVVAGVYPNSISRDDLAVKANYSPTSRHVDNVLATLRSRYLVSGGRDAIRLSDNLT